MSNNIVENIIKLHRPLENSGTPPDYKAMYDKAVKDRKYELLQEMLLKYQNLVDLPADPQASDSEQSDSDEKGINSPPKSVE